ncbi:MAG: ribose 5-phosphate isomerase B [bacterium (Candidatus Stahlbacteria) CG23_combo_of_CG06-09_8_20_14_all_34_7]|nr:MAG: ribose 5-phosphate isomerase B [bacterium (Candidatus Stahlbacteria) CG23_combo_of_CG06-09_8_20_14_all_34_7]
MKISIGSDHKGFILKEKIKKCFSADKIKFEDHGAFSEESVDYPDYVSLVADDVINKKCDFGILICESGIGMSIAANKHKGIFAAYVINEKTASSAKRHNNANVLVLGSAIVNHDNVCEIVETFAKEKFEGGRHKRRIRKIYGSQENN